MGYAHGLCTVNEGKNQRNLKNWADVADKLYALAITKYLGLKSNFGRAVKTISSLGVRSPWVRLLGTQEY